MNKFLKRWAYYLTLSVCVQLRDCSNLHVFSVYIRSLGYSNEQRGVDQLIQQISNHWEQQTVFSIRNKSWENGAEKPEKLGE